MTTFVNYKTDGSGDYHLKAGSIAVGGGTKVCAAGVSGCAATLDIVGLAFGDPPDVGVYSSAPVSTAPAPPAGLGATVE